MPFNVATGTDSSDTSHTDTGRRYTRIVIGMSLLVVPPLIQSLHHPLEPPPDATKLLAQAVLGSTVVPSSGLDSAAHAIGLSVPPRNSDAVPFETSFARKVDKA
jgi:hypothetical protein